MKIVLTFLIVSQPCGVVASFRMILDPELCAVFLEVSADHIHDWIGNWYHAN